MHVDERSTLAGMEDYSGACKDCDRHQGIKRPHSAHGLPLCLPACLDKRTHAHAHAHEVHCSEPFLSAPCSRLPGATSGTNKRKSGSIQASHHRRVLCGIVLPLAVVSRPTSMADARRTESGSGRSLGPLEPCRPAPPLYLIRFWGPVFSTSNTNRTPGR